MKVQVIGGEARGDIVEPYVRLFDRALAPG